MMTITESAGIKMLRDRQDKAEMDALRAGLLVTSIEASRERLEALWLLCETALHQLEEAYVILAEDDLDDVETAIEKAHKMERIERQYDELIRKWEAQVTRCAWDEKETTK